MIAQNGYLEQGKISLVDATIEDASTAVLMGRTLPVQYPEETSDYNGGIITANNTLFNNNICAVQFNPYNNSNIASICDCRFEFDDHAVNGVRLKNFIALYDYISLNVSGCSFENKIPLTEQTMEEYSGIYSIDSHVSVDGLCVGEYTANGCTEIQKTSFAGLYYGIYAANVQSARSIDVRHANFIENITGIYLGQLDYAEIVLNTFTVPDDFTNTNKTGLYIDMSTGYIVQQNEFSTNSQFDKQHGIVVNESGVNENLIYNNSFGKLKQGIKTQGINHGEFEKEEIGLEIRCNEFIDCEQDIRVMIPDNPLLTPDDYGIKPIQGNNGINITDPAGNRFSKYSTIQYRDIENDGIVINYWHHPYNGYNSNLIPDDSYRVICRGNTQCDPFSYSDPTQACPLNYDTDELNSQGGSTSSVDLKSEYDAGTTNAIALSTTLASEVDGGDTPEMLYEVESSVPSQSMELRDELLYETPYLSDTVVERAIANEDVLNNAMIYDIMTANPKSGRSDELLGKLDQRENPMPQYMKNVIIANASNMTVRDSLESILANENQIRQDALARLLAKYMSETENAMYMDSVCEVLHNYRINEQLIEVLFKYHSNDPSYQVIYDSIPYMFELTSSEETKYNELGAYINIIESIEPDYLYFEYDSLTRSQLSSFAQNSSDVMKLRSLISLRHFDNTVYSEPYQYEGFLKGKKESNNFDTDQIINKNVKFYPNPAGDFVIIDYFSTTQAKEIIVKITDIDGKHIMSTSLQKAPSANTIDVRSLTKGTYIFSIFEDGILYESQKVTHY